MCFENSVAKVETVSTLCKKNIQTPCFPKQNGFIKLIKPVNLYHMNMAQTGLLNNIWQFVLQIIPFLLLILVHHFLLAPLFFRKKMIAYIPVTLALLTAFGFYCFNVGNPPDMGRQPGQFQGPPPMIQEGPVPPPMPMDGMNPPMDGMRPPMMPDDGHRPLRPETMKLLMAILLIGVDLGAMAYLRSLHTEKKVQHLEAQNRQHLDRLEELSHIADNQRKAESDITFKTDYKQVRIKPDNILYIEGMG